MHVVPRRFLRVALLAPVVASSACLLPVSVSDAHDGFVRDVATGAPIAGARVVHEVFRVEPTTDAPAARHKHTELATDDAGRYSIDSDRDWLFVWPTRAGWPRFTARLTVDAPGYQGLVLRMQGDRLPSEALLEPTAK